MLALCSMLLYTYYAQNYAGIIGGSLVSTNSFEDCFIFLLKHFPSAFQAKGYSCKAVSPKGSIEVAQQRTLSVKLHLPVTMHF